MSWLEPQGGTESGEEGGAESGEERGRELKRLWAQSQEGRIGGPGLGCLSLSGVQCYSAGFIQELPLTPVTTQCPSPRGTGVPSCHLSLLGTLLLFSQRAVSLILLVMLRAEQGPSP